MVDLCKAIQNYWKDRIGKLPANLSSLEFEKGNKCRALELGYVAIYNASTEFLDTPLFQTAVPKAESSFDEEIARVDIAVWSYACVYHGGGAAFDS